MSKKEIMSAIERTIEEARTLEKENPNDPGIIAINEHRANLESHLDMYGCTHPSLLRVVGTSVIAPIGFVLSPVIVAGGVVYLGGRAIYNKIREHYTK
ncbi:hypothetical protein JW826_05905 [Candidatus Woesearchaeota archaeon]|nr:hypothetical protein [Candidatus Woesearchaeota archaeon]